MFRITSIERDERTAVYKNIYAYIRSDMNERILVILNKAEKEQKVSLDLPEFYSIRRAENLVSVEKNLL